MVNDSRLWKGTLTMGADGADQAVWQGQTTNFIVEQQDGDTEDSANVLSGETIGGEATPGPWHATGTAIQDFDARPSLQEWSWDNRGQWVPFEFVPNDKTLSPTVSGEILVKFLGLGGDVKSRITRDLDWAVRGDSSTTDPTIDWPSATPPAATGATAGTPGTFTPSGSTPPADVASMTGIVASPTTAWTTGQYVQTGTSGTSGQAYWDGSAWQQGKAA